LAKRLAAAAMPIAIVGHAVCVHCPRPKTRYSVPLIA